MSKYYDYSPILSYNALVNMIVGGRGIGKSYGAKKLVIDKYMRKREKFMYVRRYKGEIASARAKFFDDIAHVYPGYMFRAQGNIAQMSPMGSKGKSWEDIGYFVSLSTVQSLKSVPFPEVTTIIFDEFIPEKGSVQYLPDEHNVLLNLLNTVDRHQDKTSIIMLANAVSIMNPHFLAYGIEPKTGAIRRYGNGLIVADFPSSDEYNAAVAHTRTARLFALSEQYNEYATLNEFADNLPTMIGLKPSRAIYKWSIELTKATYSLWQDYDEGHYYVQAKRPKSEHILTINALSMDHDKTLVTYADLPLSVMRTAFRHGRMSFDSPTTRNAMAEIFKR